ncbi:hypothetical protein ABZW02_20355 [Streptomyces sp. NPDC005180]|uniref:hypothetical protein n=1 Tax=Streptomyces sp. NPDC005180 TaxID=3156868 RepID=UPI0033A29269
MDPVFDAARFRYWLIVKGVRNAEVAAAIGRTTQTVRNYARGSSIPPRALVPVMAGVLGVDVLDLLDLGQDDGPDPDGNVLPLPERNPVHRQPLAAAI